MPIDVLKMYEFKPTVGFSRMFPEPFQREEDPSEKLWPDFLLGEGDSISNVYYCSLYVHRHDEKLWSNIWRDMAERLRGSWASSLRETELRTYSVPLAESFKGAAREYPSVAIDPNVMAGAPCIAGTRIPVYMVLDALEYYGTIEGTLSSYPGLTAQQVKDSIGFAKSVVECPIDDETASAGR